MAACHVGVDREGNPGLIRASAASKDVDVRDKRGHDEGHPGSIMPGTALTSGRIIAPAQLRHNNTRRGPLRGRGSHHSSVLFGRPWRAGSSRCAELIRHHRAPNVLMQIAGQHLGAATGDRRIGERIADAAKIHKEILGSRHPIRAE